MKKGKRNRLKQMFMTSSCDGSSSYDHLQLPPPPPTSSDAVREEYANAFRTASYFDFWTRVLELTTPNDIAATRRSIDSGPRDRLPSYRLFAEQLLDPDQARVTRLLDHLINIIRRHHKHNQNNDHEGTTTATKANLLHDYFAQTADASLLCGLLLKDIDHVRTNYRSLNNKAMLPAAPFNFITPPPTLILEFNPTKSSLSANPFASSSAKLTIVQSNCSGLLTRLESARTGFEPKLQRGCSTFPLTTTLTALLLCRRVASSRFKYTIFKGTAAMLDMASKGSYLLCRDLDTISRLIARLQDEFEHLRSLTTFWLHVIKPEDQTSTAQSAAVAANGGSHQVVHQQLNRIGCSLREQIDELEEHLYLCFMTINRARNLVVTTIHTEFQLLLPTS